MFGSRTAEIKTIPHGSAEFCPPVRDDTSRCIAQGGSFVDCDPEGTIICDVMRRFDGSIAKEAGCALGHPLPEQPTTNRDSI